MEQSILSDAQTLRARSKSALIRGILSAAIPSAAVVVSEIVFFAMFFPYVFSGKVEDSPQGVFVFVAILLAMLLVAGIVMLVLGYQAWQRAKSVALDARAAAIRRPPMSIVAHILGLQSFVTGIILVVIMALYLIFAIVAGVLTSMAF